MPTTVGTLYAEVRASNAQLRRDFAESIALTRDTTAKMGTLLDQFGQPAFSGLGESARRVKSPLADVDGTLRSLAHTSRGLVGPIAGELSPAFDGIGIRMAHVLTTSASLGSGLGSLAIAATGVTAIIGGRMLEAW